MIERQKEKRQRSLVGTFFAPESMVVNILDQFSDMVILNVLCILCSLPIITAGISISAACACSVKMKKGRGGGVLREFLSEWKRGWKQVTPLWMVMACLLAILLFEFRITADMPGMMQTSFRCILTIAIILWMAVFVYVFPLMSVYQTTRIEAIKNAVLLSVANLQKTILMMAVVLLPVLFMLLVPKAFGMTLLFLLVVGVEGIIMVNCIVFLGIMKI